MACGCTGVRTGLEPAFKFLDIASSSSTLHQTLIERPTPGVLALHPRRRRQRHRPTSGSPNKKYLIEAMEQNPDGVGFCWWDKDTFQWEVYKDVKMTRKEMLERVDRLEEMNTPWAVHFRWSTGGQIDTKNCHPFKIGDGEYLMHNGTLPVQPRSKARSDTWQFAMCLKTVGSHHLNKMMPVLNGVTSGSRMLYMTRSESGYQYEMTGSWTQTKDGHYSNTRCFFKKQKQVVQVWPAHMRTKKGKLKKQKAKLPKQAPKKGFVETTLGKVIKPAKPKLQVSRPRLSPDLKGRIMRYYNISPTEFIPDNMWHELYDGYVQDKIVGIATPDYDPDRKAHSAPESEFVYRPNYYWEGDNLVWEDE